MSTTPCYACGEEPATLYVIGYLCETCRKSERADHKAYHVVKSSYRRRCEMTEELRLRDAYDLKWSSKLHTDAEWVELNSSMSTGHALWKAELRHLLNKDDVSLNMYNIIRAPRDHERMMRLDPNYFGSTHTKTATCMDEEATATFRGEVLKSMRGWRKLIEEHTDEEARPRMLRTLHEALESVFLDGGLENELARVARRDWLPRTEELDESECPESAPPLDTQPRATDWRVHVMLCVCASKQE